MIGLLFALVISKCSDEADHSHIDFPEATLLVYIAMNVEEGSCIKVDILIHKVASHAH